MATLRVAAIPPANWGRDHEVGFAELTMGSDPRCHIQLPGPNVAPFHARVTRTQAGHILIDHGAPAGTYVAGQRVSQHNLRHGDVLQIGPYQLMFLEGAGAQPIANAPKKGSSGLVIAVLAVIAAMTIAAGGALLWINFRDRYWSTSTSPSRPSSPAPTDPFTDAPAAPAVSAVVVNQTIAGTDLGISVPSAKKGLIGQISGTKKAPSALPAPAAAARAKLASSGYALSGTVYDLSATVPAENHGWLGSSVVIAFPLTAAQLGPQVKQAGAVFFQGPYANYVPGELDRAHGRVLVRTSHLSPWEPAAPDSKSRVATFIREQAEKRAMSMKDKLEDKAVEYANEMVEKLLKGKDGKSLDGEVKATIFKSILSQREHIAEMAKASGSGDYEEFNKNLNLLIGKAIVDNVADGTLKSVLKSVTENTEVIEKVADAAGNVAEGQYWEAIEILGKAYSEKTAIYKVVTTAAKVETALMDTWVKQEFESSYKTFAREGEDGWTYIEGSGSYGEILEHLRLTYPGADKMSRDQRWELAKQLFRDRKAREQVADAEEKKLKAEYEFLLQNDTLFQRLREANNGDDAAAFGRFTRILSNIERELSRMGLKEPWTVAGKFVGQDEMRALLAAYTLGGPAAYRAKLAEYAKAAERYRGKGDVRVTHGPLPEGWHDETKLTSNAWKGDNHWRRNPSRLLLRLDFTKVIKSNDNGYMETLLGASVKVSLLDKRMKQEQITAQCGAAPAKHDIFWGNCLEGPRATKATLGGWPAFRTDVNPATAADYSRSGSADPLGGGSSLSVSQGPAHFTTFAVDAGGDTVVMVLLHAEGGAMSVGRTAVAPSMAQVDEMYALGKAVLDGLKFSR